MEINVGNVHENYKVNKTRSLNKDKEQGKVREEQLVQTFCGSRRKLESGQDWTQVEVSSLCEKEELR